MLFGDYAGPKAALIQAIIKNSERFPQIKQTEIQETLWAILARARFKNLSKDRQKVALLLAPKEVALWQADVVMDVPRNLLKDAVDKLPAEVKAVFEAEQKLRDAFHSKTRISYSDLERFAVPQTEPPKTSIPGARWSFRKESGVFVRATPSGYSKTRLEVIVPRTYTLQRDRLGRITQWKDADGWGMDVVYESTTPLTSPEAPGLKGWLVKSATASAPGGRTMTVTGKGYILTGTPTARTTLFETRSATVCQGRIIPINEWREQQARAQAWRDWYESFRRQLGLDPARGGREDDVTDMDHYRDGAKTIFGDPGERYEWIAENQRRQNESLADAIRSIRDLGNESEYDPSRDVALPASTGAQRLGMSTRGG
jgi:hypothetical protein